jgi:RNA polymerase sigma-70 factor (ECF subfamily)
MTAAIKLGNELAFRQVFLQLRKKVYGYFLKKTNTAQDAEDLVQQTFLKLWQYRTSLDESLTIEHQVFHISRTVFIDYLRKQQVKSRPAASLPDNIYYLNEEFDVKKQVYQVLDRMPAQRKKIFELNRFEGYSYAEIAAALSISIKAVDNQINKAVHQLKKALALKALILFFSNLFF